MPIELAHGLQVMQMCDAFTQNGIEVELLVPRRVNKIKESPFSYYGIKKNFSYTKIPVIDLIFLSGKSIFFIIQTLTFLACAKIYLLFKSYSAHRDILYTREQAAGEFFDNVVLEIHSMPKRIKPFHIKMWGKARHLVVLTSFIKSRLVEQGISGEKITVAPDGVNLSMFDISIAKEDARTELGLPQDKKLVGYVGMLRTLGMEKGIDVALKSMHILAESSSEADKNIVLVLVGGYEADIEFYKKMSHNLGIADRIIFVGKVPHARIPVYLKAFDILVAPFPENEHYNYYMSPMKVFEYMGSKRPIITTNLPSLKEVVGDGEALLVEPGSAPGLAEGIQRLFSDTILSENLAKKAFETAKKYEWKERAKMICDSILKK